MGFTLNKNDRNILLALAEYRLLTASQIAALLRRSPQVLRRRLRALQGEGLIRVRVRGFEGRRGRPEHLIPLESPGLAELWSGGQVLRKVSIDRVTADGIPCVEHHLPTNWFRIHLERMTQILSQLSVVFLSQHSPFMEFSSGKRPSIYDRVHLDEGGQDTVGFTPDGVFSITDKESKKTLLFFLEVDMGTETHASNKPGSKSIHQKILTYQEYFRSERYKRYQCEFGSELNGFRLLFLAASANGLASLCRLVREMPPHNFIWLTDQQHMFEIGTSAEIWVRGGLDQGQLQSILGSKLAAAAPLS